MLICWFYRRMISASLDADHALPRRAQDHVARCPSCRDFYETGLRMGEQLAASANHERVSSPPFLQGRIVAALNRPCKCPRAMLWRPAWTATALAVALVALTAWFMRDQSPLPPQPQPGVASGQSPILTAELFAAAASLPGEDTLLEWGQKLGQPLETELKSVLQDARKALAGLAQNFLPDGLSPIP
ncbi:MAG: hypothetical protein FJ398_27055 [Verrucomicrobia bacterium]|nr:hypothetical protein [Verrucomicrobiota bacterium]